MLSQSQKHSAQKRSASLFSGGSLFGGLWRGNTQDRVPATISKNVEAPGLADVASQLTVVGSEDKYSELVSIAQSGEIFRNRLVAVLHEIAIGAMEMGARELYIGHPREYRYEFFVDDRGFQGAIKPSDYFGMLKLFGEDSETEIAVDWPDVEVLQLSLTNNNLNPVIHVAWRYRWLDRFVDEEFSDHVI